jgi:hypothetical protein
MFIEKKCGLIVMAPDVSKDGGSRPALAFRDHRRTDVAAGPKPVVRTTNRFGSHISPSFPRASSGRTMSVVPPACERDETKSDRSRRPCLLCVRRACGRQRAQRGGSRAQETIGESSASYP